MTPVIVVGLVVMAAGVLMVLVGIVMAWEEFQSTKTLGAAGFLEQLANLLKALAGQPKSVVLFTFGTVLIFLGGVIAGVSGLTAAAT